MKGNKLSNNLTDELSVDVAAETEEFVNNPANIDIEAALSAEPEVTPESELDVQDGEFWDEGGNRIADPDGDADATAGNSDSDVPTSESIIKYKANGEDTELDISTSTGKEQLIKLLAQADGMKKAFTEKAKLSKRYKKLQATNKDLTEYKETFDKLEEAKDDPAKLMELLTGESYEDFIAREVSKRTMYETGSDEERRFFDAQSEIEKMKSKEIREAKSRETNQKLADGKLQEARTERMRNVMTKEFHKYGFDSITDESLRNSVKETLWESAVIEAKKQYKHHGRLTQKMVTDAFEKKAKALNYTHSEGVEKGVDKLITAKKEKAKAQAQAASTRNYTKPVDKEIAKLSPRALFSRIRRGS